MPSLKVMSVSCSVPCSWMPPTVFVPSEYVSFVGHKGDDGPSLADRMDIGPHRLAPPKGRSGTQADRCASQRFDESGSQWTPGESSTRSAAPGSLPTAAGPGRPVCRTPSFASAGSPAFCGWLCACCWPSSRYPPRSVIVFEPHSQHAPSATRQPIRFRMWPFTPATLALHPILALTRPGSAMRRNGPLIRTACPRQPARQLFRRFPAGSVGATRPRSDLARTGEVHGCAVEPGVG